VPELRQSPELRAELEAAWQSHPKVIAFKLALRKFARTEGLDFDVEGMNRTAAFVARWTKINGPLPDSGIITG
jgi:hypothetical protein